MLKNVVAAVDGIHPITLCSLRLIVMEAESTARYLSLKPAVGTTKETAGMGDPDCSARPGATRQSHRDPFPFQAGVRGEGLADRACVFAVFGNFFNVTSG